MVTKLDTVFWNFFLKRKVSFKNLSNFQARVVFLQAFVPHGSHFKDDIFFKEDTSI